MMNILEMALSAFNKNELIKFMRGDGYYMIESSQYSPCAELTDVSKVLSRGIYKVYEIHCEIKTEYKKSILLMLEKTDFDVYMACLYLSSQLFKEKNELSPFIINKKNILKKAEEELEKRKLNIKKWILYPSGYKNKKAWEELERLNLICKEEYNMRLF